MFDEQLRSRFEWLRDPDATAIATPPVLIGIDVLFVKGRDVSQRPLRERRARLEDLLAGASVVYPARRLAPDGLDAWAQVIERGYEGLVAKDQASPYESGRTMRWLKVKQQDWTVEEDRWRRTISAASSRGPTGDERHRRSPPARELRDHDRRAAGASSRCCGSTIDRDVLVNVDRERLLTLTLDRSSARLQRHGRRAG